MLITCWELKFPERRKAGAKLSKVMDSLNPSVISELDVTRWEPDDLGLSLAP